MGSRRSYVNVPVAQWRALCLSNGLRRVRYLIHALIRPSWKVNTKPVYFHTSDYDFGKCILNCVDDIKFGETDAHRGILVPIVVDIHPLASVKKHIEIYDSN